jgi:hypothetical protein
MNPMMTDSEMLVPGPQWIEVARLRALQWAVDDFSGRHLVPSEAAHVPVTNQIG